MQNFKNIIHRFMLLYFLPRVMQIFRRTLRRYFFSTFYAISPPYGFTRSEILPLNSFDVSIFSEDSIFSVYQANFES